MHSAVHPLGPAEGSEYYYYSVLFFLPMNYRCLEAVHPRGPAERAHEHYYPLLLSLSFFFLLLSLFSMHILRPEVVHPCGLAEGLKWL